MTPDRWREVSRIYGAVLTKPESDRATALAALCSNDAELRAEVESLLQSGADAALLDRAATERPSTLGLIDGRAIGTQIGVFRIDSMLGVGGMGEVYRARDTKLNRDVAIKILPPAFAGDPDRLARFKREAQGQLASLNHPNIGGIYGFEDAGAVHALVLELVEGATLADRIARGPLAVDETLAIARQVADALEAAHEQGIIHRDLKPANIKVRDDGTVKVLDFGLAKAIEAQGSGLKAYGELTQSPTITTPAMTAAGMILGTAAYMSPEQAKGKPADKRSDIWAFGAVLFEMLAGERPFKGEDVADTLAAVLRAEPDWKALPSKMPAGLRRGLTRCLQKDRRQRLADIADLRFELFEPPSDSASISATTPYATRTRFAWLGVLALASAAFAAYGLWPSRTVAAPPIRFSIPAPPGWTTSIPASLGPAATTSLALSPDGRYLAFVAMNVEGRTRLWIRAFDQTAARELSGTDDALGPFWSPDSRAIAFYAAGRLKRVSPDGGEPSKLCDTPSFNSGSWGDGVIVFARSGGNGGGAIQRIPERGGVPEPASELRSGEILHIRPTFLPDGRHYLFRATSQSNSGTWVGSLDSYERKLLKEPTVGNMIYASGRMLYMSDSTLMAQSFDTDRLDLTGEPMPVVEQVQTSGVLPPVGAVALSSSGVLAYRAGATPLGSQLTWFDRSGNVQYTVGPRGDYQHLALSRDGTRFSVSVREPGSFSRNIWVFDAQGVGARFTADVSAELASIWSPTGDRVIFTRDAAGSVNLFQRSSNNVGPETAVLTQALTNSTTTGPTDWSPDGGTILYNVRGRVTSKEGGASLAGTEVFGDLWALPLGANSRPRPFLVGGVGQGRFSPDGRWVAYASTESGTIDVHVAPFPGPGRHYRISTAGGHHPQWQGDGKALFFMAMGGAELWAVDINLREDGVDVGTPHRLFAINTSGPWTNYAVSPDGQRFLVIQQSVTQNEDSGINVIVNWPSLLSGAGGR